MQGAQVRPWGRELDPTHYSEDPVRHSQINKPLFFFKDRDSDTCYNTDEPWGTSAKSGTKGLSQSQKDKYCVPAFIRGL